MPSKTNAPAYMRVAEGMYGEMLGGTKRSELLAAAERWADDELYIIAHLLFLNLQALEALRQQGEERSDQLVRLGTALAELAEELEEEEESEEDLTGEGYFEADDETPPALASSVFAHPVPPEGPDGREE